MKNENEALIFGKKRNSLKRSLGSLKEEGIIPDETYHAYMRLISTAQISDQLDEIAQNLFEFRHSARHSVSFD